MDKKKVSVFERYFTKEIGIEFKACLYFFAFLFFYCTYRVILGIYDASILHMAEMIFINYLMGYLQMYLLWNFDEAEKLGAKELFGMLLCTLLYTGLSYGLGWFDQNKAVTLGFFVYILFMYLCVYFIFKFRRRIDEKILNEELEAFKERKTKK